MLQLVDTNGGKLNGRLLQVRLAPGPKLEVMNATVSGNTDGKSVVLNISPIGPVIPKRFVFSGSLSEGVLSLSGGGAGQSVELRLSAASVEAFNSLTSALSKEVELMQRAHDIDRSTARLEAIVSRMASFNARADQDVKSLPASEGRLRLLTQRMASALARQRSIPLIDRTAVVRGQIGVAINQAGVEASQFHLELQSKQAQFRKSSTSLLLEAAGLMTKCRNPTDGLEAFTGSLPAWKRVCAKCLSENMLNHRNHL